MDEFNITIIVPVLNRPKNIEPLIKSFSATAPSGKVNMLFVTGENCKEEIQEINRFTGAISIAIAPEDIVSWSKRINWGINYSANNFVFTSPSTWVLCGADDIIFHPNWFEIAEERSKDFVGIIGTNDLGHPATIGGWHTTHPIVSRKYIMEQGTMDELGKFCHEGYHHNYTDVEAVHTAMKRGAWRHEPKCIIEHIHPAWNKATWDDVYQKGSENVTADSQLWQRRKQQFNL